MENPSKTREADLRDIERELWLRARNNGTIVYTGPNELATPIKDMSNGSLIAAYFEMKKDSNGCLLM